MIFVQYLSTHKQSFLNNIKVFFVIFIPLVWISQVIGSPFIFGDGYGYYHVAKNMVNNQSLTSVNAPEYLQYAGHGVVEYNNKYVTPYSIGNAILWLPFLTVAKVFDNGSIFTDYYKAFNGHSLADGIAIQIAACFYLSIALMLIFKTLRKLGFSNKISIFAVVISLLSSYTLGYTLFNAAYSHVYEFFAISAIYYLLINYRDSKNNVSLFMIGLFMGLLVLIRPIDLVLIIPLIIYLLSVTSIKKWFFFLIPSGFMGLIFLSYNYISYGSAFKTGYSIFNDSGFSLSQFNLFNLLLSDIRGWLVYSPVFVLSLAGLILYSRRSFNKFAVYLMPSLLLFLIYSFWSNWWAGDSIGQRFFIVLVPVYTVGLAYIASRLKNKYLIHGFVIVVTLMGLYSILVLGLYRFTPTAQLGLDSSNYPEVTSKEKFSSIDILKYHANLISMSDSLSTYYDSLKENLTGGRSLAMVLLGHTQPIIKIENRNTTFTLNYIADPVNHKLSGSVLINALKGEEGRTYFLYINNKIETYKITCKKLTCYGDNLISTELIDLNPDLFAGSTGKTISNDGYDYSFLGSSQLKVK